MNLVFEPYKMPGLQMKRDYTKTLYDYIKWFEEIASELPVESVSRILASITDHATFWLNRQELSLGEYSTILDRLKKITPTRSNG